ncbi:hypothetical protein ADUPG1_007338, partial [Aduncisulcus paluster]
MNDHKIYSARGGKEPWHTLIDVHVLSALRLATKCDGDTNPEEFLAAIKKFFGAGSTQGFYDQLRRIKLKKMKEPELVQYVAAYQEVIASNPDFGNDDTVGRLFLGGLRNRRLPARHAEFVREEIDRLMEKGIIVRAKSRFASPILVVPKKGN